MFRVSGPGNVDRVSQRRSGSCLDWTTENASYFKKDCLLPKLKESLSMQAKKADLVLMYARGPSQLSCNYRGHRRWKDQTARERTGGHTFLYAEAKEMKSVTTQTSGCLRASLLRDCSSSTSFNLVMRSVQ